MLTRFLYANAGYRPNHDAIVYGDECVSNAELLERVERLAAGLQERGVRAGDAVAVILPNGPAFVTAFLAVAGLGAIVVPLNPQFKTDERQFCMGTGGVRHVLADKQEIARMNEIEARR